MTMTRAVLIHQRGDANANVRWVPPLPESLQERVGPGLERLRAQGYFASAFPEGDGLTVRHASYDSTQAYADISAAFPWLALESIEDTSKIPELLNELHGGRRLSVRYLVPVDKLLLHETIDMGPYVIHRPVVPHEHTVMDHPYGMDLLDVPGADIDPGWDPATAGETSLARYLGFPLIEGRAEVDASLFFPTGSGVRQDEALAKHLTEHADRALDVLRHRFCNQDHLEQVPQHAGVLSTGFREAYLFPDAPDLEPRRLEAKPEPFEAVNVWLGLEVSAPMDSGDVRLAEIASGTCRNAMEQRLRAALRARGQSFFIVNPEMRFASLVFANDAIAVVGEKTGDDHRRHVAAVASRGDRSQFDKILVEIDKLYGFRNAIVHRGASFAELRVDATSAIVGVDRIVMSCMHSVIRSAWETEGHVIQDVQTWLAAFA